MTYPSGTVWCTPRVLLAVLEGYVLRYLADESGAYWLIDCVCSFGQLTKNTRWVARVMAV